MRERDSQLDRLATWLPWILTGLGLALFVSIRLQLFEDEVPNPDISGILYNADGLLRGELPYVHNAELKPLGAFYVVAGAFKLFGRDLDTVQWAFSAWLILGLPALALALPPHASRVDKALSMGVYLYYAGMFTYNYTAWMMPVYVWGFAGVVRSLRARSWRWALLGGIASAVAFGFMQRSGVLGVVALILWGLDARRGSPQWTVLGGWIAGAVVGAGVMAAPYLAVGQLGVLLEHLLPWSVISSYTGSASGGFFAGLLHVPGLLATTFAGALVLSVVGLALSRRTQDRTAAPAALFVVVSIIGTGLGGGRFYLHYMPQVLPALAVLIGALGLGRCIADTNEDPRWRTGLLAVVGLMLCGSVFTVATGDPHRYESRARRLDNGKSAAQAAGAHIRARTDPSDTIYGWGWTSWRVYFWAQRRAPGRYYKALGRVTTFNTNTAFDPGDDIVFSPGPHSDAFIADFDAHPPEYFVLSPSFTQTFGAHSEPLEAFEALSMRLQRDYRPEAEFGDLLLLRRQ
ncbi:MAG: hypothetical protein ACRBN8_17645 [Nannocystales bacterium]